jgi:hypothetical protein
MNVVVKRNGVDITNYVLGYKREQKICTGVGNLEVVVDTSYGNIAPGDTFILEELGNKKATYTVESIQKDAFGTNMVTCIDGAKRLLDYFIDAPINIAANTYNRYWIIHILDLTGVTYNFTTASNGSPMANDSIITMESAYNALIPLLQQSGWYFYFDEDNTCQIGELEVDTSTYVDSFNEDEITEIIFDENDSQLRNRAVVWGYQDFITGTMIYADMEKPTPWDRDANDKRSVVLSNSNIRNWYTASDLARKILDQYAKLVRIKKVQIVGSPDIKVGDMVFITTRVYKGLGQIYTLESSADDSGLTTNLILDEVCPRLFGFFSFIGFVYIATRGSGVWRKLIEASTWTGGDYSTGLTSLDIIDLAVCSGILACVDSSGGAYTRALIDSSWTPVPSIVFTDEDTSDTYTTEELKATSCSINQITGDIHISYRKDDDYISWILTFIGGGTSYSVNQVKTLVGE